MATKGDLSKARTLIDEYHKNDPAYLSNQSQPPHNKKRDEQTYSDNVERWVIRLIQTSLDQPSTSDLDVKQRTLDLFSSIRSAAAAASDSTTKTNEEEWSQEIEILKLAARCQHLGRYLHPRQDHPPGKAGYLKWRRELYQIQADRASTILSQSGFQEDLVNLVASWVAKKGLKVGKADQSEWGAQLLEDSAILVFLEDELESFAEQHQDYQKEKFLDIIRKTWRKLSTQGKEATRQLSMPKGLEELIHQAVGRLEEEEEEEKEKEKAGEGKEKETQETIKVNEEGREQMSTKSGTNDDDFGQIRSKKSCSSSKPYRAPPEVGTKTLRANNLAEAQALLGFRRGGDGETEEEEKIFGARILESQEDVEDQGAKVWTHNAWDHVTPPAEHLAMVEELLQKQSETKLDASEASNYHSQPCRYWDAFYSNHENRFFKDRRWLHLEFPELVSSTSPEAPPTTILEVGCGAGNTVFPLLEMNRNPNLTIHACDYSSEAIQVVKSQPLYSSETKVGRCQASVWDLCSTDEQGGENLPEGLEPGSVDYLVLIFVFSALRPEEWERAFRNVRKLVKPVTGMVLFRDYGRYDLPQLRFRKGRMLEDNFYVRGDGTRVYFFTPEEIMGIFKASAPPSSNDEEVAKISSGSEGSIVFETVQMAIDRRLLVNRKERKKMYRVWMQAKFRLRGEEDGGCGSKAVP